MSIGPEKPAHNLQLLKVSVLVRGGSIRNFNITLYLDLRSLKSAFFFLSLLELIQFLTFSFSRFLFLLFLSADVRPPSLNPHLYLDGLNRNSAEQQEPFRHLRALERQARRPV